MRAYISKDLGRILADARARQQLLDLLLRGENGVITINGEEFVLDMNVGVAGPRATPDPVTASTADTGPER